MDSGFPSAPRPDGQRLPRRVMAEPTMPGIPAAQDGAMLALLRRDLDDAVFRDVLAGLEEELALRRRSVLDEPSDWRRIRDDAQAVLSLAAGFGFDTLAGLSRAVLSACECPARQTPDVLHPYAAEMQRRSAVIAAMRRDRTGNAR